MLEWDALNGYTQPRSSAAATYVSSTRIHPLRIVGENVGSYKPTGEPVSHLIYGRDIQFSGFADAAPASSTAKTSPSQKFRGYSGSAPAVTTTHAKLASGWLRAVGKPFGAADALRHGFVDRRRVNVDPGRGVP